MSSAFQYLSEKARGWLSDKASARGTTPEIEALDLLDRVITERMEREDLLRRIDIARPRLTSGTMSPQDIEDAINWGRD